MYIISLACARHNTTWLRVYVPNMNFFGGYSDLLILKLYIQKKNNLLYPAIFLSLFSLILFIHKFGYENKKIIVCNLKVYII